MGPHSLEKEGLCWVEVRLPPSEVPRKGEGGEWLGVSGLVKAILLPQKWCNRP